MTARALLPHTAYNLIIHTQEHRQSPQGMRVSLQREVPVRQADRMLRQSWQPAGGASPSFLMSSTRRELRPQSTGWEGMCGVRCVWRDSQEVANFLLLPRKMVLLLGKSLSSTYACARFRGSSWLGAVGGGEQANKCFQFCVIKKTCDDVNTGTRKRTWQRDTPLPN